MKRWWWLAGVGAVLVAAFVMWSGQPGRVLTGMIAGSESLAYLPPRRDVVLVAGPPQPTLSLADAGIDPASIELAVRYAGTRNTSALVVGWNGHVVHQKFWKGLSLDSEVDLSGFTPVLAALVLGTAQQNGEIRDLDTPVSLYLEEWLDDPRGTITLRDLLTGNSNLAAPASRTWPRSLAAGYYAASDLHDELLRWPQAARPGAGSAEVDADILALALSRAFHAGYADLLKERIWQPLGGGSFSVAVDAHGSARAGCCLRARISDWMRVGALIANHGIFEGTQLSPPEFAKLLVTPTHEDSPRAVFLRIDGRFAARDLVRLEAAGKQRMWIVPSLKLVILRVGAEPAQNEGWDEPMIPDSIIRGTRGWRPAGAGEGEKTDPSLYAPH
jgi:CubicO group peptidase (beta-lactamase class C family)